MTLKELMEKRAALAKQAREFVEKAESENRAMTAEENEQYDKLFEEIGNLKDRAERQKLLEDEQRDQSDLLEAEERSGKPPRAREPEQEQEITLAEQRKAFCKWMLTGEMEKRAGAPWTTTDAAGGYMAPTAVADRVVDRLMNDVYMIGGSDLMMLPDAKAITIPNISTAMTAAAWGAVGAAISADSASVIGATTLTPVRCGILGYVNRHLLRTSSGLAERAIENHIVKQMGEIMETGFVAGSGSNQPTGVFLETALTGQEVNGGSETSFDYDDLVDCVYNITQAYRRGASWLVHRDFCKMAAKLTDGEGRPLWYPSLVAGKPDNLMGYPVWESEYASNTFTADKRIAVFGNFARGYGIALSKDFEIIRLNEKYAEYDAVGYIAVAYADGNSIDDNAFSCLHTKA
jgi:HK97 family phage major capsid protein